VVDLPSVNIPLAANESSIQDPVPGDHLGDTEDDVMFEIIPRGTEKGFEMLLDSQGYKYCNHHVRNETKYWRCCIRSKQIKCLATVVQRDGHFISGRHKHSHAPNSGQKQSAVLIAEVSNIEIYYKLRVITFCKYIFTCINILFKIK